MSDKYSNLMTRVESLEKQNRRLRRVGGGLVAALGIVGLMSMAAPTVCKTVWGERFVLRDGSGRDRMLLNAYNTDAPSLTMMNEKGKGIARLSIASEGLQLQFFENGKPAGTSFPVSPAIFGGGDKPAERRAKKKASGPSTD
ncbi:MAG: hypothetical protein GY711_09215 [bacterium]|nr:hypothetical protein [bacterium]